jgi:hypothetical protein
MKTLVTVWMLGLSAVAAAAPEQDASMARLATIAKRLAPVELKADLSQLPTHERQALAKMVQAAAIMDGLFLGQVWAGNASTLLQVANDDSPVGRARLKAFMLNKGPWDRIAEDEVFLPGTPPKPPQANFYPSDATREEVEAWVKSLPAAEKKRATGFYTTIRRGPNGKLTAVPYNVEYQAELQLAAKALKEAAALTQQPTLKKYLQTRADAFLSNNYYASDVAWMELDASIEPTIGPYEVYEDKWFNHKAAFEGYVALRDDAETQKLQKLSEHLQLIEDNLPIEASLRNPKLGALAPIRVVNLLFSSGDGNKGVQTAAFNLPNDEKIAAEKGTKRTMLKNVQEAKFSRVLVPIAQVALSPADQKKISFDAFFTAILMHELMHGLGPHNITVNKRKTTVRQELQELSSAIEEAKADVSGIWALQLLMSQGKYDKKLEETLYTTMLASGFRSIRFGIGEAHAKGMALQLNYFLDKGAVKVAGDGTFSVDLPKMKEAVSLLTGELMTLQASGDRAKAKDYLNRMAVIRPEVQKVLERMAHIPTDIDPRYTTAQQLLSEESKVKTGSK